jgi:hypothetical protein
MSRTPRQGGWLRGIVSFQLFSPKGFLICAATFSALFLACHLAGFRGHTGILCGQMPPGSRLAPFFGMAYVLFYFAFVLLVPVLAIAAAILALLLRLLHASRPPTPPSAEGDAT